MLVDLLGVSVVPDRRTCVPQKFSFNKSYFLKLINDILLKMNRRNLVHSSEKAHQRKHTKVLKRVISDPFSSNLMMENYDSSTLCLKYLSLYLLYIFNFLFFFPARSFI